MTRQQLIGIIVTALVGASLYVLYPIENKLKLGLDLRGGVHIVLEIDDSKLPENSKLEDALAKSLEIIRRRVDELGLTEPVIQPQGEKWIVVQMPGVQDPGKAKKIIGKTARWEFRMVVEPEELAFCQGEDGEVDKDYLPDDIVMLPMKEDGSEIALKRESSLDGSYLEDATVTLDEFGSPRVSFRLRKEGEKIFADLTGANVGRRLAIMLDNLVYSAPVIRERISGGEGVISGKFNMEEVEALVLVLRAGALPVPINIISERVVGPTLGADSVHKGSTAASLGLLLVVLFMIFYYRASGVIADLAVFLNILFLLAVMAKLGAVLTMPGIAGIILTIGVSVDANVLIFERIREELRLGKTVRTAIEAGYNRALWTIIDSHVTTLITAVVLFQFGTGPIRGFAVTLFWGVSINLFTAFWVTKAIFDIRKERRTLSI